MGHALRGVAMSQTNDGGDNVKSIQTAADTDEIREVIESVYDGWYANESRIDWTDFLGIGSRNTDSISALLSTLRLFAGSNRL